MITKANAGHRSVHQEVSGTTGHPRAADNRSLVHVHGAHNKADLPFFRPSSGLRAKAGRRV